MPASANDIGNKIQRTRVKGELRADKARAKRERRDKRKRDDAELGTSAAPPRQVPRTLESAREFDETLVSADDGEIVGEEAMDEYANYFAGQSTHCLLVSTTRPHPAQIDDAIFGDACSRSESYDYDSQGAPAY
eukprot:COSAG01_NODE_12864_length_1673_cov_1.042567_3_plen_134_part_00